MTILKLLSWSAKWKQYDKEIHCCIEIRETKYFYFYCWLLLWLLLLFIITSNV